MQRQLSEIEKHGAATGETSRPHTQDWTIVLRNLDDLLDLARIDFGPLYDRVRTLPDFDPGDVLPTDAVITRGTGRYHRDKRNGH